MGAGALTVDAAALPSLRASVDRFLQGDAALTGLELYYLLERATPLRELHTVIRQGPQNLTHAGLQQSYGDHNRLLLLGLDRLVDGDLDWYRGRLEHPGAVTDEELLGCIEAVRSLGLGAAEKTAIWLAAALHDCGLFGGGLPGIDVEDGVVLAEDVLDALCPLPLRDLASFAIRNHDYIKDVFLGEVPARFVAEQIAALEPALRPTALAVLGMIQVAGAASLGNGRLSAFRVGIFDRCLDGTALDDQTRSTRLARLDSGGPAETGPSEEGDGVVAAFLDGVPVHRWHAAWSVAAGRPETKAVVLARLARLWSDTDAAHIVLADGIDLGAAASDRWQPARRRCQSRNGVVALLVG